MAALFRSKSEKEQSRKEYEEELYKNWQSKRADGKWKFVWRFGIVSWSLTTFMIYWIFLLIIGLFTKSNFGFNTQTYIQAGFSLVMFIIVGFFYGQYLWNKNEKIFLKKFPYGK